uniref:Uncharacterized protein n=1 Tax=Ditylum brightwellii TaxID=49249 RepID=A0A7S4SX16_9STRA
MTWTTTNVGKYAFMIDLSLPKIRLDTVTKGLEIFQNGTHNVWIFCILCHHVTVRVGDVLVKVVCFLEVCFHLFDVFREWIFPSFFFRFKFFSMLRMRSTQKECFF